MRNDSKKYGLDDIQILPPIPTAVYAFVSRPSRDGVDLIWFKQSNNRVIDPHNAIDVAFEVL